jgi:hypothetical protein
MKMVVRLVGWVLIAVAIVGGVAGVVLVATNRISGGMVVAGYVAAVTILVVIIGWALTRVGRRRKEVYDAQWTRKAAPERAVRPSPPDGNAETAGR